MAGKAAAPAEKSGGKRIVSAPKGLNLREGPGREFKVLTVLPAGETVTLPNTSVEGRPLKIPGWVYVFAIEGDGWVDEAYLSRDPAEQVV